MGEPKNETKIYKNSRLRIQPGHWIEYGKRGGKRSFCAIGHGPFWTYISTRSRGKILKSNCAPRDPNISRFYLSKSTVHENFSSIIFPMVWNPFASLANYFKISTKSSPTNHHQLHLAQALLVDQLDLRSLCFSLLRRRSGVWDLLVWLNNQRLALLILPKPLLTSQFWPCSQWHTPQKENSFWLTLALTCP